MNVTQLYRMTLKPGEQIVAAVPHQDCVIAVTNRGTVYKIEPGKARERNEHG